MPVLKITNDGISVSAPKGGRLMEILEEHESGLLFGCGQGACGSCRIRVDKGADLLSPAQDEELTFLESLGASESERLACQCRVVGGCAEEVIAISVTG